jgi:hypothetical protein
MRYRRLKNPCGTEDDCQNNSSLHLERPLNPAVRTEPIREDVGLQNFSKIKKGGIFTGETRRNWCVKVI